MLLSYAEALDVALCFGWIDGQKARARRALLAAALHPARPRGRWSQINRDTRRRADCGRPDARGRVRRGRAREGRRPLGGRLRRAAHRDRPRGPARGARRQPGGAASSSRRSTAPTATRSSTGCTSQAPATRAARSSASSRCSPRERRSTPRRPVGCSAGAARLPYSWIPRLGA